MKKLYVQNLVLIITEKCNLNCRHCIRGNGYNINMSDAIFNQIFDEVKGVNNLIISGGEPFVVKDRMIKLLDVLKEKKVKVEQYGLATNGTLYDQEIEKIFDQYEEYVSSVALNDTSRINEKYHGYIDLSLDKFHYDEIVKDPKIKFEYLENIANLKKSKYFYSILSLNNGIIKKGNAIDLPKENYRLVKTKNVKIYRYENNEENFIGPMIAISANGSIVDYNVSHGEINDFNYGNVENGIYSELTKVSKKCNSYKKFIIKSDNETFRVNNKSL